MQGECKVMCQDLRAVLWMAFGAAIERVNGERAVLQALAGTAPDRPVHLIAVGKAAAAMTRGALASLGDHIRDGVVITKHGHLEGLSDQRLRLLEADHPVPGQASLTAGAALVDYIASLPAQDRLLALISGGASSLVEVLPDGFSLEDLRALTQVLLASGLDIHAINRIRKSVSMIKGGKLLNAGAIRDIEVLLISDVRGDDPGMIGSGLFYPDTDPSVVEWPEAAAVFQARLPQCARASAQFTPPHRIVASLSDAMSAAAEPARGAGFEVFQHDRFLDGEVGVVADELAGFLISAPKGIHLWGGETTVVLPEKPGRGGRNQHLGLCLAQRISGKSRMAILTAGTDGTDGPGDDAGALVDGGTVARGEAAGVSLQAALAGFDAGRFLEASGDLVNTGPTGTNVMDLVIAAVA